MLILVPPDAGSRENQTKSFLKQWEVSLVHDEELITWLTNGVLILAWPFPLYCGGSVPLGLLFSYAVINPHASFIIFKLEISSLATVLPAVSGFYYLEISLLCSFLVSGFLICASQDLLSFKCQKITPK